MKPGWVSRNDYNKLILKRIWFKNAKNNTFNENFTDINQFLGYVHTPITKMGAMYKLNTEKVGQFMYFPSELQGGLFRSHIHTTPYIGSNLPNPSVYHTIYNQTVLNLESLVGACTSEPSHDKTNPEDHWSCIAHLSAENMLKSAVIEEKNLNIALGQGQTTH